MRALRPLIRVFWDEERRALLAGVVLLCATLAAGAALLGLSGWFITASAVAGLAGAGATFDFFRPSAGIRFLALVRTAARYGERLSTHDATLRLLAVLRVRLFGAFARQPFPEQVRMRGALALNRITADVDALDAVFLRLISPAASGVFALALGGALLAWLTHPLIGLWIAGGYAVLGLAVMLAGLRIARGPMRRSRAALDALRLRLTDLARGNAELTMAGALNAHREGTAQAAARAADAALALDRIERFAGSVLQFGVAASAAGALYLGWRTGLDAPRIALAVLAAFGLGEVLMPLQRSITDGCRAAAAARALPELAEPRAVPPAAAEAHRRVGAGVVVTGLSFRHAPDRAPVVEALDFDIAPGECVTLTGASGSGKSTVLHLVAGLLPLQAGRIAIGGRDICGMSESELRARVGLLPQRSVLFAGSVAENLRLAAPEASEQALWSALDTAGLRDAIAGRGGLESRLGEGGSGLSGGESRRLALARLLLRGTPLLLLDEPVAGLDAGTAERVLANLRAQRERTLLIAGHRAEERAAADRCIAL